MQEEVPVCNGEEWRPVVRYESIYEVSSLGRVRRIGKAFGATPGYILKNSLHTAGYATVVLRDKGRDKKTYVHILVAEAFLGPRPPGHEVNHKDKGVTNHSLSNLEYTTHQENQAHAAMNGSKHYKLYPDNVIEIKRRYASVGVISQVAREFGIDPSYCGKIIRGIYWPNVP